MKAKIEQKRRAVSVEVQNLHMSYGLQEVIRGVSFRVEPGEIFVLMGPSGVGKSVLLRNIIGLEMPTSGKILVDELEASDPETQKKVVMALVFQAGALFNSMTVFDNLAFYPRHHRLYDKAILQSKVKHTLEILALEKVAHKYPSSLSGGMRKRVAIARALMMEPQLILYDEPTSELDPISAANISEVIGTLREEFQVTSIVVSHDRELALSVGQRVALMVEGQIAVLDTPEEFQHSEKEEVTRFLHPEIDVKNPRFRTLTGYEQQ